MVNNNKSNLEKHREYLRLTRQLIQEIDEWWIQNSTNVITHFNGDYEEEYNEYDEEPSFVTTMKKLKEEYTK